MGIATCLYALILSLMVLPQAADISTINASNNPAAIVLKQDGHQLHFDPKTGALASLNQEGLQKILSTAVYAYADFDIITQNDTSLHVQYPATGLSCQISFPANLEIKAQFTSTQPQTIRWPKVPISKTDDYLIWPKNGGYYIPFSDSLFASHFLKRSVNTLSLSLPFWAVERKDATTLYLLENPFHNVAKFQADEKAMYLILEHQFTPNPALSAPHELLITDLNSQLPIAPALYFRERLIKQDKLRSFQEKMEEVPALAQMIGAPWAHLVEGLSISQYDIRAGKWLEFVRALCKDGQQQKGFAGQSWTKLPKANKKELLEMAMAERLNNYQKKVLIRSLSHLLKGDWKNGEFSTVKRANAEQLYQAYPTFLLPPKDWGDGISIRMIDALKEAGLERMMLQASGHQEVADRKEVVAYANEKGFLFGVYDSYHSIHDPSTSDTDHSWPTAQMTEDLFENGRMMKEDGTYYGGFKGTGGLVNPLTVRPYYEERVAKNFAEVPYSYYFVDCDAFGEYYDDYKEGSVISQQEDVAERLNRLDWLRRTQKVPIGSEKGIYLFANSLDINEGVAVPIFGFWDKDMKNKKSPYYTGSYWPPEMMENRFKEVPLKEKYYHLHLDPTFKIPLWETVYHDCLVSTAHPAVPSLKYSNAKTDLALTEIFYQYPPIYNLNMAFFEQHKERIVHHYQFYSQTHPKTVHHPVTAFDFLTEDRLVQYIEFGSVTMVANFGATSYKYENQPIAAKSVLFIDEDGTSKAFNPEAF